MSDLLTPDSQLSQFLDNELDTEATLRLLASLEDSAALQAKLQRYIQIQQALKTGPRVLAESDFLSKIKDQLDAEPAYLLPARKSTPPRKPAVVIALAASLAAVAVIIPMAVRYHAATQAHVVLAQQAEPKAETAPVARSYPVNRRFQDYLQAHNSSAYINGASNIQSPIHLVGYAQQ